MKDDVLKELHDILEAASNIHRFLCGKKYEDYAQDELLRSAVE